MLTNKPNECICIESNVKTQGILYSDYFTVVNRYCITRNDANSSRLIVSSYINYIKNPNFIAKSKKFFKLFNGEKLLLDISVMSANIRHAL